MRNLFDTLTGKVSLTVQLDKGIYNFLKDASALNAQTPSEFIADVTRSDIKALIGTLAPEWFDQQAIMKKYGLLEVISK